MRAYSFSHRFVCVSCRQNIWKWKKYIKNYETRRFQTILSSWGSVILNKFGKWKFSIKVSCLVFIFLHGIIREHKRTTFWNYFFLRRLRQKKMLREESQERVEESNFLGENVFTPGTQDVNRTHIWRSEDVQDVFQASYVRSMYVLCPGGIWVGALSAQTSLSTQPGVAIWRLYEAPVGQTQVEFTCLKSTLKTAEQCVKSVQS